MSAPPVRPSSPTSALRAHNDALAASVARVRAADARQMTARLELAIATLELRQWRLGGDS